MFTMGMPFIPQLWRMAGTHRWHKGLHVYICREDIPRRHFAMLHMPSGTYFETGKPAWRRQKLRGRHLEIWQYEQDLKAGREKVEPDRLCESGPLRVDERDLVRDEEPPSSAPAPDPAPDSPVAPGNWLSLIHI